MKKTTEILMAVAAIGLAFLLGYNTGMHRKRAGTVDLESLGSMPTRIDTVRITDTVEHPRLMERHVVRHDTIFTPVDTVYLPIESQTYTHSVKTDSVSGEIKAKVSGYSVSLDSLIYDLKITKETVYVKQRRKWNLTAGPTVGVGYGSGKVSPYVGIGITYGYSF